MRASNLISNLTALTCIAALSCGAPGRGSEAARTEARNGSAAEEVGPNLLKNPSFEEPDASGLPKGWMPVLVPGGTRDRKLAHSGNAATQVGKGYVVQAVAIEGGKRY